MGRKLRLIDSGKVAVRQKGDFFQNFDEKSLYEDVLHMVAHKYSVQLYGYILNNNEVFIFLECEKLSKFMQIVNSSFIRKRNNYNVKNSNKKPDLENYSQNNSQNSREIRRYEVTQVFADDIDPILAYIAKNSGVVFKKTVNKELSLDKKIEIEKFRKRNIMKIEAIDTKKHSELMYHKDAVPNSPFSEIVAGEAGQCEHNFSIVFTNDVVPKLIVMLGKNENLIINENYNGYIPANVQNYPFFLVDIEGKGVLCIDTQAEQLQGEGIKLFENEKPTEFMENLIKAMQNYNIEQQKTKIAMQEIKKSEILVNKELSVNINGKKHTLIKGFSVVSKKKLNELDDATLADFVRRGYMELIYTHLRSLSNLENLASRIVQNESK